MYNNSHLALPGFAGVALADILANGAAIIILLIIIILNVKNSENNEKVDKAKDVATLLSREIAKTVVLNALPTSSPARLHNYTKSHADLYPRHQYMPILELHEEGIRNFYTKEVWPKHHLLKADNTLDHYLSGLSLIQKRNMRLDIYSIENFYLLMSILKSHHFTIRHWHFNGETHRGHRTGEQMIQLEEVSMPDNSDKAMPLRRKSGLMYVPDEIAINATGHYGTNYPEIIHDSYTKDTLTGSTSGNSTIKYISKNTKAVYSKEQLVLSKAEAVKDSMEFSEIRSMDYRNILAFLFDIMIELQYKADNHDYDVLANLSLENAMYNYIYSFPKLKAYTALLIEKVFTRVFGSAENELVIEHYPEEKTASINLKVNDSIEKIVIKGVANIDGHESNPDIMLRLSLFPAAYRGVILPINKNSIILFSHENFDRNNFKWRMMTLINTKTHQSHIGFIYSKFDRNNQLVIKAEENMVMVNNQPLHPLMSVNSKRHDSYLLVLYALVSMLVLVIIIRRFSV